MTDLENLYHHAIQRVRLYPCCFSGAKRDYPVFALYPPEYQYFPIKSPTAAAGIVVRKCG